jgi:hypothetical protein
MLFSVKKAPRMSKETGARKTKPHWLIISKEFVARKTSPPATKLTR